MIYATFRAFQREEVSRLVPLGILSTILISGGAAIFFGERLSTQQYVAFALFLVGAVTLSIRVDKKMILLYDLTNLRIDRVGKTLSTQTQRVVNNPMKAGKRLQKDVLKSMKTTYGMWKDLYGHLVAYAPWQTGIVKQKTRLKPIRGLWWYMLVIILAVPFTLLLKDYNTTVGTLRGFIAVRIGLFIGSILLALGHWHDIVVFVRQTKLFVIASIKESFGMVATYFGFLAAATGPLAIVQSMGALNSVGVFIAATVLTRLGILHESLRKRDIIQKCFGILCIAAATVLLFV
jgi:hypothetical protein